MVLLEVRTPQGTYRRCSAACHYAATDAAHARRSRCICQGAFRGIGDDAINVTAEELDRVRQSIPLVEGETVQLRIGA